LEFAVCGRELRLCLLVLGHVGGRDRVDESVGIVVLKLGDGAIDADDRWDRVADHLRSRTSDLEQFVHSRFVLVEHGGSG